MAEEQNLTDTSFADMFIQFLTDEQEKGNKRFKSTLDAIFEPVFPGFSKAIDDLLEGADERKKQLEETFGLTGVSPGEAALGFGVGSIKRISGVKGLKSLKLGGKEIVEQKPKNPPPGPKEPLENLHPFSRDLLKLTRENAIKKRADAIEASTGQQNRPQINAPPGTRPPLLYLEAQAVAAAATKRIQTKVKEVQKDLDALLIAEANPLVPPSLVQEIAKKGLRAKAIHETVDDSIGIAFKSKNAVLNVDHEFMIITTESGPVLAVNFRSPTLETGLAPTFKQQFKNKFLDQEEDIGYYSIKDFTEGLHLINEMLAIANER